jgi:peptidoglycan-associated lipoprotein
MKATKIVQLLVIALAITMVTAGCRKKPGAITPLKDRTTMLRDGDPGDGGMIDLGNGGLTTGDTGFGTEQNPLPDIASGNYNTDESALAAYKVHFDFDSSVVRASEQGNVEAVASYLKANPNVLGLRVDGHCDERGTEDYNNALGERRALALRDAVIALGVEADRVITQTFGENKPIAVGQDESAYSQNRRGEFIVLLPK